VLSALALLAPVTATAIKGPGRVEPEADDCDRVDSDVTVYGWPNPLDFRLATSSGPSTALLTTAAAVDNESLKLRYGLPDPIWAAALCDGRRTITACVW
jgi:hypothetical protein